MPFWSSNVSLVNVKKQQDWKKLFFLPSTDSCEGQTSAHSVHSERVSKRAEGSSTANTAESGWFPCAERSADPDRQNRGTNQFTFHPSWTESSAHSSGVFVLRLTFIRSVEMTTCAAVTCSSRPHLLMRITFPSPGEYENCWIWTEENVYTNRWTFSHI